MALILASASPRRKELLGLITPHFTIHTSDVDESALTAQTPAALAQMLAQAKCAAVAAQYSEDVVIGCDTVVDVDGTVFGKPVDRNDARRIISTLSGRTHLVHTGVCLMQADKTVAFTISSAVTFAALTPQEIETYIATPEPYDKAGAYGIQGGMACFVEKIDGCFYNVMGFPVSAVYAALRQFSVTL